MELSGVLSAASRRVIGAVAVAVFLGGAVALATPRAAAPDVAGQAQEDNLKFNHNGPMMIIWTIKAGQGNNFVLAWKTIKDELKKMGDAGMSAFADSINIKKVQTPAGQDEIYVFDLDQASATYSYNPVVLLYTTLKEDPNKPGIGLTYDRATEVYNMITGSVNMESGRGIVPWLLTNAG